MMELQEIKKLHDKAYDHGEVTRDQASSDLVFYSVTQWDDNLLAESQLQYRGQFDVLRKAGRQILSKLRSNPVQVDFKPKADSRQDGADFLDGLYRTDDRHNISIEAYNVASQEAVICGVGAWMLYTEYETNLIGDVNQVIRRKPLYEANNKIFWDPNAKLQDKSDAKYVSVLHAYSEDGYKEMVYDLTGEEPDTNPSNFSHPEESYVFPWYSESSYIYVTEFFYREKVKSKVFFMQSPLGEEMILSQREIEEIEDDLIDAGFEVVAEKEVERYQVTRYLASGSEIIDESIIAGENIPVVPVYGERQFVEDEEYYEGITRLAKDPQRLRNFQMSYLADIVSRSPRQKPIFTPEQLQGYEFMYEESGSDNNYPYLLQNTKSASGADLPPGPVGLMPEQKVPDSLMVLNDLSRQAIEDVANDGLPQDIADPDLSGKAIYALQNQQDRQSMIYQDSLKHAKRRDGVIYASMAVEVYDAPRKVTLTLADGQTRTAESMEYILDDESGNMVAINDLTNMEFDVYSDIGPSYSSQKEQNMERVETLLGQIPPGTPEYNMLLLKYLNMIDGDNFDDVREYANKQLISQGYKEPETEEEIAYYQQMIAAQQGQQDPQAILAQAESEARMMEGRAALQNEINDANQIAINQFKAETDRQALQIKAAEAGVSIQNKQADTQGKIIDNNMKLRGADLRQSVNV